MAALYIREDIFIANMMRHDAEQKVGPIYKSLFTRSFFMSLLSPHQLLRHSQIFKIFLPSATSFEVSVYYHTHTSILKSFKWEICHARKFEFLIWRGLEMLNQKSF